MSYKQTWFSLEKRQGPVNKRVKLVFKLCLEGIDKIIRSSAGRDLVKTWAAWGKVCLKCWDKLSSHSMEGAPLERLRSLCYAESEFLVLPGCPFSAPWQVFFCDHLCFCKWQCSTWDGWREKREALFSTSQILVLVVWLLVSTVVNYTERDGITVVITTKIDLCSKWPSVVLSCILRNKSCFFPWWCLVFRQYL